MPPKANKSANASQPHLRPVANAASPPRGEAPPSPEATLVDANVTALKTELLCALREEMPAIFKAELHAALGDNLSSIKSELLVLKTELSSSISSMQQKYTGLKDTVSEMEQSLSTCTDDIGTLRAKVEYMSGELVKLESKCDDLESRSRRNNVRIVGVPEDTPDNLSTEYVSKLLMEAFTLEKEPLVDRAHRTLAPKPKPGERPRAIVARLHYYTDCANILKKARELQRIKLHNMTISVFPDYTAKTARARAAFNEVRRQLRDIEGVRFGILHPAKLRITYEGVQRDFTSPAEAKEFISKMIK